MIQNVRINSPQARGRFIRYLEAAEIPETGWFIEWQEYKHKRSQEQNKMLWAGIYRPIAQHMTEQTGKVITAEHVHEACKQMFCPVDTNPITGKGMPRSTTKMTKQEFGDYIDQVSAWATEMGVFL